MKLNTFIHLNPISIIGFCAIQASMCYEQNTHGSGNVALPLFHEKVGLLHATCAAGVKIEV